MSVIIKGMEMPTSCDGSCPLYDREFLRCNITYTEPWWGHDGEPIEVPIPIPSDCPLVPVPPHGRLIDADALMETFRERKRPTLSDGEDGSKERVRYLDFISTLQAIKDAPTIIETEEGE